MDVIKVSIRCNDTVDYDLDGLIVFKGDAGLISPHIVVMVADDQGNFFFDIQDHELLQSILLS